MAIDFVFLVIDAFAVFAFTLVGIQYLHLLPKNTNAHLLGLLCLGAICHVVLGRYQYSYWIVEAYQITISPVSESILNVCRNASPGVFMLLSHSMLRDGKTIPRILLVLFFVQLFLEEPIHFILDQSVPFDRLLTEIVPTILQSLFLAWAIFWIVVEWSSDLIESRRRTRFLFLLLASVNMLCAGLLQRILIPVDQIDNYFIHMLLITVYTLLVSFVLVRSLGSNSARLLESPSDSSQYDVKKIETRTTVRESEHTKDGYRGESELTMNSLHGLINDEHVYRLRDISVRSLADELRLPEYRLRKLIHEGLGFRNFNAFLHHFRIGEACEMLSDPNLIRTPILTIALTVGYQSISTFNRAFREVMGEAPSAYRSRNLVESNNEATDRL